MKKILFLLLCTVSIYGQTYPTNPTAFGKISINTNVEDNTATKISVQSSDNRINWLQPVNIPIPTTPTNYVPTAPTLGGHLSGIDAKLGTFSATTAGISTRVWFTADVSVVSATNYYATNATSKGTAASAIQNVVNNDNEKKYFAQDLIGNPFATATMFPPGVYAGNVSASTSPNAAQQRWTVELYKCTNAGVPVNSGVTGAPVGSLGVQVITILDSGLLTLADGNVTNVQVSGNLVGTGFSIAVGERIRYHVSAEKFGAAGANITQSVYYGTSYNSFIDVPVTFSMQSVYNTSANPQIVTNATQGALTLKRGSAADTDNILVGQNAAGVNTFGVDGSGKITAVTQVLTGSINAVGGVSRAQYINTSHTATANNDVLTALEIKPTFNNGAFTGVRNSILKASWNSSFLSIDDYGVPGHVAFYANNSPSGVNYFFLTHANYTIFNGQSASSSVLFTQANIPKMSIAATTGNLIVQNGGTFVDNGVDRVQVTGTVLSQGFKVAGTPGLLKSDGTVDTNIYSIDSGVVHLSGTETITGFKTIVPIVNTNGFSINMPAVNNSPTGFAPGATLIHIGGHNGATTSQVQGVNVSAEGNRNVGYAMNDLNSASTLTNSTAFGVQFRNSSTNNTIIQGEKGAGNIVFKVTDAGILTAASISKIGATATDVLLAGGGTLANPVSGSGANGQIAFWNGANTQTADASLFWDNTSKRLHIGGSSPGGKLQIDFNGSAEPAIKLNNTAVNGGSGGIQFFDRGVSKWNLTTNSGNDYLLYNQDGPATGQAFKIEKATGAVQINNLSGTGTRQVVADASGNLLATAASVGYLKYVALLTQTGTSAPTATVLENTLGGTVVWTRTATGDYLGTLSGVFTLNKTAANVSQSSFTGSAWADINTSTVNAVHLVSNLFAGSSSDGLMNKSKIEIVVYP